MRSSVLLGSFLFLLPVAALGHDAWVASNRPELGDIVHAFRLTDVGWVWLHYSKDSYDWARENLSADFWSGFLDPLLSQKTVLIASAPLAVLLIVTGVTKASGYMQRIALMGTGDKIGKSNPTLKKKTQSFKYKRH
jgi:hypothetical protein